MFTGIIQSLGKIEKIKPQGDGIIFSVNTLEKNFLKNVKPGGSIAVNGACMTVTIISGQKFTFNTINESLSKTSLGSLIVNDLVNLERPLSLNTLLDGNIVQGHIDTTGRVTKINPLRNSTEFFIEFSSKFKNNIIEAGSIAINGVSLTVAGIVKETSRNIQIKIAIIPFTSRHTSFSVLKENDPVNIEFDMIGKYIQRILNKN